MSTIEERTAYLDNPFKTPSLFGDYSAFYVTIAICTVLGVFIFAVNIIFGCCSRHKSYWQDRHTGNRWLVSFWTATPHNQPPLDLTELKDKNFQPINIEVEHPVEYQPAKYQPPQQTFQQYSQQHHQQQRQYPQEYVELHQKRESDI